MLESSLMNELFPLTNNSDSHVCVIKSHGHIHHLAKTAACSLTEFSIQKYR